MNGLLLLAIAAALLLTAYLVYGRYLVKTWGIDPKAKTPAYEKEDGVDYVPSNKWDKSLKHTLVKQDVNYSSCSAGYLLY